VSGAWTVAALALRESLRRRVFLVVLVVSAAFAGLYAWGASELFDDVSGFAGQASTFGLDARALAGATYLGIAMFGTLFLGVVLATFLTLGAIRGDAERGLLQPVVVRPVGRRAYLGGRLAAAAAVSGGYAAVVFTGAVLVTGAFSGWWPDRPLLAGALLVAAVLVLTALALLGSILLSATANGIAVMMIFGAGLVAGLLGQVGEALASRTLERIADVISWALPFEALYRASLAALVPAGRGLTETVIQLGPLGGSKPGGPALAVFVVAYLLVTGVVAVRLFERRDL
jgi:ABC-type transport system involved in multi-copper enzyme maturation permease subunit